MSKQICQYHDFKVYRASYGYIVHNTHKDFAEGHTHVENYNTCMVLIKLVERKQLPKSKSKHFIESLIRISDDRKYVNMISDLMVKVAR